MFFVYFRDVEEKLGVQTVLSEMYWGAALFNTTV